MTSAELVCWFGLSRPASLHHHPASCASSPPVLVVRIIAERRGRLQGRCQKLAGRDFRPVLADFAPKSREVSPRESGMAECGDFVPVRRFCAPSSAVQARQFAARGGALECLGIAPESPRANERPAARSFPCARQRAAPEPFRFRGERRSLACVRAQAARCASRGAPDACACGRRQARVRPLANPGSTTPPPLPRGAAPSRGC